MLLSAQADRTSNDSVRMLNSSLAYVAMRTNYRKMLDDIHSGLAFCGAEVHLLMKNCSDRKADGLKYMRQCTARCAASQVARVLKFFLSAPWLSRSRSRSRSEQPSPSDELTLKAVVQCCMDRMGFGLLELTYVVDKADVAKLIDHGFTARAVPSKEVAILLALWMASKMYEDQ